MAIRTTDELVRAVLLQDYDVIRNPSLTPFIRAANNIVNRMVTAAAGINFSPAHSTQELLDIETWVAAFYYTHNDPVYTSKSQLGASASFVRDPDHPNPYLAGALSMDTSGMLKAIIKGNRAGIFWAGKTDEEKLTYTERN